MSYFNSRHSSFLLQSGMTSLRCLFFVLAFLVAGGASDSLRAEHVNGYTKKDGTHVSGYERHAKKK